MLSQIYFGIPLWAWLIIIIIIITSYNNCSNSTNKKTETFADTTPHVVIISNYNTEWCGWSRKFQPEWDKFCASSELKQKTNITVKDVKCDNKNNEDLCGAADIPGFPSVVVEIDGKKTLYEGERTSIALIEFIKNL